MTTKINVFLTICIVFAFFNLNLFNTKTKIDYKDKAFQFKISQKGEKLALTDLMAFDHFVTLGKTVYPVENLQNIIATDSILIAFDGRTDYFERLYFFDYKSGQLEKEIQFPKHFDEGILSVRSISYDPKQQCVFALSGGRKSILKYSRQGQLIEEIPVGLYGSKMEVLPNGDFLVEASMNEDGTAKNHRLVLFDRRGGVKKRFFPYQAHPTDFLLNSLGVFNKINDQIYYAWPLDDTIYAYNYKNKVFKPLLIGDFEAKKVPFEKRLDNEWLLRGGLEGSAHFNSSFSFVGDIIVFSYVNSLSQLTFGFIDTKTNQFYNSRETVPDEFSSLLKFGEIVGTDGNKIIFKLKPARAMGLLKKDLEYLELVKQKAPLLYDAIKVTAESQNPSLLFFEIKK
jgi:6-bladed beta-propeller